MDRLLQNWRRSADGARGALNLVKRELKDTEESLQEQKNRGEHIARAQHIVQEVAQQTQAELEYHISGIVSMALASVFEDPYDFIARFETRGDKRRTTECKLLFSRDGEEMSPMDAAGGGPVDVASFALRVAFLSMENPQSRRIMVLDEPFGFVSLDLQHKCSAMLKAISEKLGLQVIMVTHKEELVDSADRVFLVQQDSKGRSAVRMEGE